MRKYVKHIYIVPLPNGKYDVLANSNQAVKISETSGTLDEERIRHLESAKGKKLFTKSKEYAFSISYDHIIHLDKHYKTMEGKIDVLNRVYSILGGFDYVKAYNKDKDH